MESSTTMISFLSTHMKNKTKMKVFLSGKNTMLTGSISSYDDKVVVIGDCMVLLDKVISMTPETSNSMY